MRDDPLVETVQYESGVRNSLDLGAQNTLEENVPYQFGGLDYSSELRDQGDDDDEQEDPRAGRAEDDEGEAADGPAADLRLCAGLRLVCRVVGCSHPRGHNGALGFKGVQGYLQHLGRAHKEADVEDCAHLLTPYDANTNPLLEVKVPGAAKILGVLEDQSLRNKAVIPYLPDCTPPPAPVPGSLRRRTTPSTSDINFASCLDTQTLLRTSALVIIHHVPSSASTIFAEAVALALGYMGDPSNGVRTHAGTALHLLAPRLLLHVPHGQHLTPAIIILRCQRFLAGDWCNLLMEYLTRHGEARRKQNAKPGANRRRRRNVGPRPPLKPSPAVVSQVHQPDIDKAVKHIQFGNLRCAREGLERALIDLARRRQHDDDDLLGPYFGPPLTNQASEDPDFIIADMKAAQVPLFMPLDLDTIQRFKPSTTRTVDAEDVKKAIIGMAHNKAGGPSGLRSDHISALVIDNPTLLEKLVVVTQRLVDGTFPPDICKLLTICDLYAVPNKKKPRKRPITCEEWLLRMASRYSCTASKRDILKECEPIQLGGSKCGCEVAVHATHAFGLAHPGLVLLQADQEQAFQRVSRQKIFEMYMAHPKLGVLVPLLRQLYLQDSQLHLSLRKGANKVTIINREGAKQGAPESSPTFNLVTLEALKDLLAEKINGPDSEALIEFLVAIADDTSIFCLPGDVPKVLTALATNLAKVGGKLNYDKTYAYFRGGILPPSVYALGLICVDDSMPDERRGVVQLGVPYGSDAFVQRWFEEKLVEQQEFLDFIAKELAYSLQSALVLIRLCILPRMNYLARCLPVQDTVPYLERFDVMVQDCVLKLIGTVIDPDHPARHQMRLKLSLGGLGIISTAKVAPAAYVASVIDSMPLLKKLGQPDPQNGTTWLGRECADLLALFKPQEADGPLDEDAIYTALCTGLQAPSSSFSRAFLTALLHLPAASRRAFYQLVQAHSPLSTPPPASADDAKGRARGLQHTLAGPIHEADEQAYRELILPDTHRTAQHLSQRQDGDGGKGWLGTPWLQARPRDQPIATPIMRVGIMLFLGLPDLQIGAEDTSCPCSTVLDSAKALTHFSSCNLHHWTKHHDSVGNALDEIYTSLPGNVLIVNNKTGIPQSGDIMDKVVSGISSLGGRRMLQDQTVPNPHVTTNIGAAIATANATANSAHDTKLARYLPQPGPQRDLFNQKFEFFPISMEMWGGTHDTVVKRLGGFAQDAAKAKGLGPKAAAGILQIWRRHLSVALMMARVEFYLASLERCIEPGAKARRDRFQGSYVGDYVRLPSARVPRWGTG